MDIPKELAEIGLADVKGSAQFRDGERIIQGMMTDIVGDVINNICVFLILSGVIDVQKMKKGGKNLVIAYRNLLLVIEKNLLKGHRDVRKVHTGYHVVVLMESHFFHIRKHVTPVKFKPDVFPGLVLVRIITKPDAGRGEKQIALSDLVFLVFYKEGTAALQNQMEGIKCLGAVVVDGLDILKIIVAKGGYHQVSLQKVKKGDGEAGDIG